jgi:hypothetical protein
LRMIERRKAPPSTCASIARVIPHARHRTSTIGESGPSTGCAKAILRAILRVCWHL